MHENGFRVKEGIASEQEADEGQHLEVVQVLPSHDLARDDDHKRGEKEQVDDRRGRHADAA